MKQVLLIIPFLSIVTTQVNAQWGNMPWNSSGANMMPWGGQTYAQPQYSQPSFGSMMPWGQAQAPVYQTPQQPFAGMMPWGNAAPRYQAPTSNSFASMMPWGSTTQQYRAPQSSGVTNMMPWGVTPQPQYSQPQSTFMMPGMEQGIRSMMQPGRIMAEEATPGMYMKPTWR